MTFPCQCVLILPVRRNGQRMFNMCGAVVSGPDEPMCDQCLADGHAEAPRQLPLSDPARAGLFPRRDRARG